MAYSQASPSLSQYPRLQLIRGGVSADESEPVTVRFVKVPVEVVFNAKLSPWARLVYCALQSHKGERGIFPRQEVLATELGTSTDTVGRALKELRANGLVEIDRQGRGHANRYSLSLDTAPMRNHTDDDTAPVQDQNAHDSASLLLLETAPVRFLDSAPVRNPIRTRLKELEPIELEGANAPAAVAAEPVPPKPEEPVKKPRTEKQLANDRIFERRSELFTAYCRGVGIDPESFAANQRKSRGFRELTPVLDAAEMTPDVMEQLARFSLAAFQWRKGNATPFVGEVLQAFPEWDQQGRPGAPKPKTSVNGTDYHNQIAEGLRRAKASMGGAVSDDNVVETTGRVIR